MSGWTVEEQIHELARNLAPVRPIPPLRAVVAAALALGLASLVAHWLLGGPGLRPADSAMWSLPYLSTLAGLVVVALASLAGASAAAVPGRETAVRLGARGAMAGAALAVAGGLWGVLGDGLLAAERLDECLSCMGRAVALGLAPVVLACFFIVYAAVLRPGLGTALALAGGVGLGAAAVHATCPNDSPTHWLLAHTLAPAAAVVLLTAPIAAVLAGRTR